MNVYIFRLTCCDRPEIRFWHLCLDQWNNYHRCRSRVRTLGQS